MSAYPKVKAGDKFRPSARKENALSDLLNAGFRISGKNSAKQMFFSRITVYNQDITELVANSAVFFTTSASTDEAVPCKKYSAGETQWGVLTASLAPGEFGSCIVSGPVKVKISAGTGNYVQPNSTTPDVFTPSDNGVPILYREGSYAIINLGGSGLALPQEEYYGLFKLQAVDAVTLEVVNGKTPGSPDCGYTDVPGLGNIANAVLTLDAENLWYIYLLFFYDAGNKRYSAQISTEFADDAVFGELLGTFRAGKVTQVLKTMERLVFGDDWYLS